MTFQNQTFRFLKNIFRRRYCLFYFWLLIFVSFPQLLLSQEEDRGYRVAFYNLENLFHPDDDSLTADEEFTPDGMRNWSYYRYREKSNRMAKAILGIGGWEPTEIVGVAEIENRQVLEDMVEGDVLRKFNYGIIHFESPDRRGIDVGMLYLKDRFEPVYAQNIPVKMPDDPHFATRDILYVKGVAKKLDTLHLIFCHWPSRYGGQAQSEPKRIQAARTVRAIVDSIWKDGSKQHIIIAGDLNDEWKNVSVHQHLRARSRIPHGKANELVNMMALLDPNEGSHRYQGVWTYLDQIIVSANLLDGRGTDVRGRQAKVVRTPFLLEKDEKYPGEKPFRSFIGMRYNGGFSDHLPVYVDLVGAAGDAEP